MRILLVLAILGVVVLSFPAPGPTTLDTAVANLVAELPGLVGWFWEVAYDLLIIWSVCLLLMALFSRGRKRLFLYELLAVALRLGVRDRRQQRQRHQPVDESRRALQLQLAADLPRDAHRRGDRRHRDRVSLPRQADGGSSAGG